MGYWIVTATLKDGRVYGNVVITDSFTFGFPDYMPFDLRDVERVTWGGYRGRRRSGRPVEQK